MIKYPAQLDDSISLPPLNNSEVLGINFNLLRDSVLAIEAELGTVPSGVYSTVKARLDTIENNLNSFNPISLTNDLGGTLISPKVIGLQGRPITTATPSHNDSIVWNGGAWIYKNVINNNIAVVGAVQGSVIYYDGYDWIQLPPGTSGQYLKTNGTNANPTWATVVGGGGGGGGDTEFLDSEFRIQDNGDNTKQLAFQVSGISTGTTRTITVPNANITLDDVSGTRTPTDNTVSTIKLIDSNVTFAKIQSIATNTLLGRDTAGVGNIEQITLNSTLEFNGSLVLQRAAISGDVAISAGSNTSIINNASVTFSKIQNISQNTVIGRSVAGSGPAESLTIDNTLEITGAKELRRAAITGDITISNNSNTAALTISGAQAGDLLQYNGSNWVRLAYSKENRLSQLLGMPLDFIIHASTFDGYSNGQTISDWNNLLNHGSFIARNSPTVNTTGFNGKRAVNLSTNQWLDGYFPGISQTPGYTNTIWTTRDSYTFICAFQHSNTGSQYLLSLCGALNLYTGIFIDNPTKRFIPVTNNVTVATSNSPATITTPIIVALVKKDEGSTFSNTHYMLRIYIGTTIYEEYLTAASPTIGTLLSLNLGAIRNPSTAAATSIINSADIRFACFKIGYVASAYALDQAVEYIKSSSGYDCPLI